MKTKSNKGKASRQTTAKKIARQPLPLANQIARHGRTLHPIEAAAVDYLDVVHWCKLAAKHKDGAAIDAFGLGAGKKWEGLSFEVMAAVQDGDGDALRKLAGMVESYCYKNPGEDFTRRTLLSMKQYYHETGHRKTAKEIAERWLNYPAGSDLSRLRAIAKQVGYPLAPDTVGRPSKTQTRKRVLKA